MSLLATALLCLLMLGTAVLSGIFGMAGGMILMGVLLAFMPVPEAMALHGVAQMASNGGRAVLWIRHTRWRAAAAYVSGCLVALALWSIMLYVPSKAQAFILLGGLPFAAAALPRRLQPDPDNALHGIVCGLICMTLILLTGVAGPLIDRFFLAGRYDRRQIVATKATCQIFGHAAKLIYFGGLVGAAMPSARLLGAAVVLSVVGTVAAGRLLQAMNDKQFRLWSGRIVGVLAAYYVAHGLILFATG